MFRIRALSFIFGLPLMVWVCYAGGWWLPAAIIILAMIALREWARGIALTPVRADFMLAGFFIFAILFSSQSLTGPELNSYLVFLTVALVGLAFVGRILRPGGPSALADISVTVLTPLYLGLFFSFLLRLRLEPWCASALDIKGVSFPPGAYFVILLFLACWFMDTGAFLCGRYIGGPKLSPAISPGKTIAGFIGAVVTAALTVLAGFTVVGLSPWWGALLGGLLGVVGQLGDLGKSLVKREAGIKDFGLVFPAHGGVLDRFDNVLFNAPLIYYFLRWLLGGGV